MLVIAITKYPTFSGEEKDTNDGLLETDSRNESEMKEKKKISKRIIRTEGATMNLVTL